MVRDVHTVPRKNMITQVTKRNVSFVAHHPTGVVARIARLKNIVMALAGTNAAGVAQLQLAVAVPTVQQENTRNKKIIRVDKVNRPLQLNLLEPRMQSKV